MIAGFSGINTLTVGTTTVDLSDDIRWRDEFDWVAVARQSEYTTTGALVIESSARQSGRPITLESMTDAAWLPRETVDQLRTWADDPDTQASLLFRGQSYAVVFAPVEQPITADPVIYFADPVPGDWYRVTLQLIEATL